MKTCTTCTTCVFLSNVRLGAGIRCLVTGKLVMEDMEACEDYEAPNPPREKAAEVWT